MTVRKTLKLIYLSKMKDIPNNLWNDVGDQADLQNTRLLFWAKGL